MRSIGLRRALIGAVTVALSASGPACSQTDVSELEAESKELRAEIRELREDVRALRKDTRELREKVELSASTKPVPEPTKPPVTNVDAGAVGPVTKPPRQSNVKIQISSNPRGATVFLGEKVIGRTPLLFEHPPGTEQLMLRIDKPGYQPRLMSLRPDEDAKISVQLARQ